MVSSLATLLSMLGNIALRPSCLWARVANLNELPGNSRSAIVRDDIIFKGKCPVLNVDASTNVLPDRVVIDSDNRSSKPCTDYADVRSNGNYIVVD
jgi:hypothetical protein